MLYLNKFLLLSLLPRQKYTSKLIKKACQTGGPRATCGPIACSIWPAMTFFIPYMTENNGKLYEFTVISSIKHLKYAKIGIVLLIITKKVF